MDQQKHIFLRKQSDGKTVKTTPEKAQQVKLPIADYNELIELHDTSISDDSVTISKSEYNGLQKALRISRERALQQVDKAVADEHGYTIRNMKKKRYSPEVNKDAWYITVVTPHSTKIARDDVIDLIKMDLKEFYGYLELPLIEDEHGRGHRMTVKQLFKCLDQIKDPTWNEREFLLSNSQFGINVKKFFEGINHDRIAFELTDITANFGQGKYEISYWAVDP